MAFGKHVVRVELIGGPNDGDIAEAKIAPDNTISPVVIAQDRYVFWRYQFGKPPLMRFEPMNVAALMPPPPTRKRRRRKKERDADG